MKNMLVLFLTLLSLNLSASDIILLVGAPGSGKGTMGELISQKMVIPHISAGNLFRESLKKEGRIGELARMCSGLMESGALIPDEIILEILQERIAAEDCNKGFLLEGYPRTKAQAESFVDKLVEENHLQIVELDVPEELLIKRLAGRIICSECQHPYNRYFSQPIVAGKCDKCQGDLIERSDDNIKAVMKRLERYNSQKDEVVKCLENRFVVHKISCDNDAKSTFKKIVQSLNIYPRDFLVSYLSHYPFKGVKKFYNVTDIYKDPHLMNYIVTVFADESLKRGADYIAAPEARSLPIMGAVAQKLNKPALFLRKQGKTPGPVYSATYSTGYSTETLEFAKDESLVGKKVVIIDDGIANGETMLATIELLEQAGMEVVGCLVVIDHHYTVRSVKYQDWVPLTLTLFDL